MLSSTTNNRNIIPPNQLYRKVLLAHDGSEMSDKALRHAAFISKATNAELAILNVVETDAIPPSSVLAFMRPDVALEQAKDELRGQLSGGAKHMLDEKVKASKDATGLATVSSMVRFGRAAEEIISEAEGGNYDIVVMASAKITSPIRILGSTARRVLDSTRKPVLIVHE
jgi:nucleotide-binding universal stress UspA family protein